MPSPNRPLSDTELEILKALWDLGPSTVRQLNDHLRKRRKRWAYTTVQTLLGRLVEKGYVKKDEAGHAHVYKARISREKLLDHRLKELARDICEGERTPLLVNLFQATRFDQDQIDAFRQLLDEADDRLRSESTTKSRRKSPDK